jgi:hypothetical protein
MNIDGAQLARAMLSIHAAQIEQAARYPDRFLSDRIERRIVLRQGGSRTLCRLGSLLVSIGRCLQHYGMPRPLPLGSNTSRCG